MCVVLANCHNNMQKVGELNGKLSRANNEEQRKMFSQELENAKTRKDLALYRSVYNVIVILLYKEWSLLHYY